MMSPNRPRPPAPASPAVCPKCGNTGFVIGADRVVHPCDCGIGERRATEDRLRASRIPTRFQTRTLDRYKAPRGDRMRMDILATARAWAGSFELTAHQRGQEIGLVDVLENSPDDPEHRGLLLRGGTGTGKTHIAIGILIEIMRRGYSGLYCNVTELLTELRDTYRSNSRTTEVQLLDRVRDVDVLVLDDLGAESTTDWVRDRLYLIVNSRYESTLPTIITTNCEDIELRERVGPRIVSRLAEMCDRFPPFPDQDYRIANMK